MSIHNLSIQDALRDHRRNTLIKDQHEASLVRDPNIVIEPPFPIDESVFEKPIHKQMEELCECGHDRYRHWDATDDCDVCKPATNRCVSFQGAK